jgi:hydroxyacylglutathione hydrolase
VTTKIYTIPAGVSKVYALKDDGGILIDSGGPKMFKKVKKGLEKALINPHEVRLLILTHAHFDHICSARDIMEWTGTKVLLHKKDLPLLNGTSPLMLHPFSLWGKVMLEIIKPFALSAKIPKFTIDFSPEDGEFSLVEYGVQGKIIHTPGHTPGSVSVLLDSGEAFVGDLAINEFPMCIKPRLSIFGDDIQVVKESWRKLVGMGVKEVYPGHGKPFAVNNLSAANN